MSYKQYSGIDVGKFSFSILVIAGHTTPFINNQLLDRGVGLIIRLIIPFFCITTGYLLIDHLNKARLIRYLKRIITLYLIWSLIYLPFHWPLTNPIKAVLISGVNLHLWYLPALIFSVVVVYLLQKKLRIAQILAISAVFFIIGTLLSTYKPITSKLIGEEHWVFRIIDVIKPKNGLFYGFFYVTLGCWLKQKKERTKPFYYVLLIVGLSLLAIEGFVAIYKLHTDSRVLWLTCPIPAVGFFMICKSAEFSFDTIIVRNMSSMIYFSHYIWIHLLGWAGIKQGMILFVCVALISIISSFLVVKASKRIKLLKFLY